MSSELEVGLWYVDESLVGCYFKVLALQAETLDVVDSFGERRRVNRMMFEADMTLARRVPLEW